MTASFKGTVSLTRSFFTGVDEADGADGDGELAEDESEGSPDSLEVTDAVVDVESEDGLSDGTLSENASPSPSSPSFAPNKLSIYLQFQLEG